MATVCNHFLYISNCSALKTGPVHPIPAVCDVYLLRRCRIIVKAMMWQCHCIDMVVLWPCLGNALALPQHYQGTVTAVSQLCHSSAMALPWCCYGSSMTVLHQCCCIAVALSRQTRLWQGHGCVLSPALYQHGIPNAKQIQTHAHKTAHSCVCSFILKSISIIDDEPIMIP